MSFCRYCGKEISWVCTKKGRYIPIDPEPVFIIESEGTERFYDEDQGVYVGRLARPEEVQTKEELNNTPIGFIPHWKTCGQRR